MPERDAARAIPLRPTPLNRHEPCFLPRTQRFQEFGSQWNDFLYGHRRGGSGRLEEARARRAPQHQRLVYCNGAFRLTQQDAPVIGCAIPIVTL